MAWGAGVPAADSRLHPESRSANTPLNARETTNFDLEDMISDKGLSPRKTYTEQQLYSLVSIPSENWTRPNGAGCSKLSVIES